MLPKRTRNDHNMHCDATESSSNRDYFSKSYGVDGRSILNQSKHFHVVDGLVPDLMHDIFEGVLPLVLSELLFFYIVEKNYIN